MSKSIRHKLEAKFRQGLIDIKKIPASLKNKWNRSNFDWGEFRNLRNKKRLKDLDKEE
jgi:hypothetical protein